MILIFGCFSSNKDLQNEESKVRGFLTLGGRHPRPTPLGSNFENLRWSFNYVPDESMYYSKQIQGGCKLYFSQKRPSTKHHFWR